VTAHAVSPAAKTDAATIAMATSQRLEMRSSETKENLGVEGGFKAGSSI
jgi:hypothetical protein